MLNRIDLTESAADPRSLLPRAQMDVAAAMEKIRPVADAVRDRGAEAVRAFTRRFDGVELSSLRVPAAALDEAAATLDPAVHEALLVSIKRARAVHADQRRVDVSTRVTSGGTVTERWIPVSRVGLYVPGGLAVYPSSVVMNVVPAQIAGVAEIAVSSPPQRETGLPHPLVLAACALLGVTEVYAVGGAQAIAMFRHGVDSDLVAGAVAGGGTAGGTDTATGGGTAGGAGSGADVAAGGCVPVDMITGPGNIWVTAAKRLFHGQVGIDSEAGPTEIAVLADDTADPVHVAADLISQAEHDPLAASVLVTPSRALADAVDSQLQVQVPATKHTERITQALSGPQSGTVLVSDLEHGLRVVDAYAAEHLEIQTRDAREVAMRVRNAGAIFVGPYSPVSLGDYCAGSNHVLPTGGCARHSSGLSVQTFLRGVHIVEYTEPALTQAADYVITLANAEDLPAHGQAVAARRRSGDA
ncbi:MAG: histidinol dehydrogenase [Micromonosporaceae bacterium]